VRRLQRSNDELQEQVDNLTLQVDHLQNRLVGSFSTYCNLQSMYVVTYYNDLEVGVGRDVYDVGRL
jgi:hypothetical protein